ncbi:ComEC/Rec2 family competence protein [Kineosporia sp. A_224]|uniref:ComEC/Rec2 family competence protein n=1 Tax=Kineosporia sp. A_224 TaxID=1962180 RepID=UPI000B4BEE28|nr:ComEC/Rec2 family competence protein [Kineosporia sp. A_224]
MTGQDLRLVGPALVLWAVTAWALPQQFRALAVAGAVVALLLVLAVGAATVGTVRARAAAATAAVRSGGATARLAAPPDVPGPSHSVAALVALTCGLVVAMIAVQGSAALRRDAEPVRGWAAGGVVAELSGVVRSDAVAVRPGPFPGPPRYVVRVAARVVEARGRRVTAPVSVVVLGGPAWAAVSAGQQVRLTGRLDRADPADGAAAFVQALGPPRTVPGGALWRAADHVRAGLRRACAGLPPDARGLLPALVVGDTTRLPPTLVEDLRTSGLTHLTAVSGANVAVVIAAAVSAVAALGAGRRARVWLGLAAVAGFVVLARPQPSVLRAAVMGSIALVALLRARRSRGLPLLCAAVLVLLVASPGLARSPGFALSVTATAALMVLAPAWSARLERWMPRPVALALAVPAAAQAACGPIVVLLNPAVPTTAVPANLLAGPAVAPATVLGVVAALVSVVSPALAVVPAWLGGLATSWIALVAHRAAALPGSSVPWPSGRGGALLLAALTLLLVALTLRVRPRSPDRPGAPEARDRENGPGSLDRGSVSGTTALVVAAVVAALAVGWLAAPWLLGRSPGGASVDWAVAMCDVGQGDMLAVRSGERSAVLVDVGPDPDLADRCLTRLGVRHVDLLVLTHFHADHVLGLPGVLSHGREVDAAIVSRLPEPAENARSVADWLGAAGTPQSLASAGDAGEVGSGEWRVAWHVLQADGEPASPAATAGSPSRISRGTGAEDADVNDSSVATELVVRGPGGTLRIVGLGDLESDGQQALLRSLQSGTASVGGLVDVVKVAHHGSATQEPELYQWLGAPTALIGVGLDNDYGHPSPRTLTLLGPARVLRTDTEGTILLSARDPGG